MADRLRAMRGFLYPADEESLRLVRDAGGVSKLTSAQREAVVFKAVAPGDWCDDMPVESQARYLSRGEIERVTDETPALTAEEVAEFNADAMAEKPVLGLRISGEE